ncbi:putative MFS family arabinose efflux permease [Murinocardiopsis flavida]|uniref:Putative MFS family arabinose efflux permease n=1 Tax=Murinocardiopsis flavida TaxID=645275 RepID=A0A2P8DEN3_9ACTN|nr:MFS transporter [Murinocardiopsis flavida]PSK95670.1 putative MFS family arabinose efflux permease [Murinocardiopsis flavida]
MTARRPAIAAPLRHGSFRALLAGQLLVRAGNGLASVALAFAVLDLSGSVASVGLVVGARSLANVLLLLIGGVLADRLPRPLLLQGACLLAALTQALIAAAILTGTASLPLLCALSLLNGASAAAGMPAMASLTPQTVPAEVLRPANALVRVGSQLGMTTGFSLGGALSGLLGSGWALALNAAMFALAALCCLFVRVAALPPPAARIRVLGELKEGWSEFTARSWVWIVVVQFMVVNVTISGGIVILGAAIADDTFGREAWGVILGVQTVGALVGGLVAATWQPRRALFFGVALMLLEAVPMIVLAQSPTVWLLMGVMFAVGACTEQFNVAWEVSLQQNIPANRLARVYSYDMLGSFIALPVGEIAVGPIAESFGFAATLYGAAALLVAATLAAMANRGVRTLVRH